MEDTRIQQEINKYKKFKKVDGATYRKVNQFLRKRTYITAREWALARLCTDFRTSGGAEMTFIGKHLPELVPFMEHTYTPQAVNQARNSFKKKVRKASATFFYGAMCGFFTTDELDDLLFEASEVARFLLEVEGTTLDIDDEIDIEDRITKVMRGVGEAAKTILKARSEDVNHTPHKIEGSPQELLDDMNIQSLQAQSIEPVIVRPLENNQEIDVTDNRQDTIISDIPESYPLHDLSHHPEGENQVSLCDATIPILEKRHYSGINPAAKQSPQNPSFGKIHPPQSTGSPESGDEESRP
jgi:hypothetical protein